MQARARSCEALALGLHRVEGAGKVTADGALAAPQFSGDLGAVEAGAVEDMGAVAEGGFGLGAAASGAAIAPGLFCVGESEAERYLVLTH